MYRFSPALLNALGVPRWRLRQRLAQSESEATGAQNSTRSASNPSDFLEGFFVSEPVSDSGRRLLENIRRVFPQLGEAHPADRLDEMLAAHEAGRAVVFGTMEESEVVSAWVEQGRLLNLPHPDDLIEQPLLKKQVYLGLLNFFTQAA